MPKLSDLKVDEVSLCVKGMNQHARVALFKADTRETVAVRLAKMCCESERGAMLFAETMEKEAADRAYWKASEVASDALCAVGTSVRSIIADAGLSADTKAGMLKTTVEQFASKLTGADSAAALEKLAADFSARTLKASQGDKTPSGGTQMTDEEKAKMEAEMNDKLKKAAEAEVAAKVADLEKKLAKAEAVAALSDADRAYMAKLADDAARDAWLAKAPEARRSEIEKAQAGDEAITVGGATVRKSEVGAGTFAVLKSQQEAITKQAELLAKASEVAELATLAKSAADEYGHLPGTDMEKAHVLRALQSLPEDVRKTTEQILKAAEATAQFAFSKRGTTASPGDLAKSAGAFTKAVAEIQARDKCTKTEAMAKAIVEQPAAFEAYQAATTIPAN